MGRKFGAPSPFGGGELGPHLTQCGQGRGLATFMPSFILIHSTVWPQYTNVTDRTNRTGQTDNGIGRTANRFTNSRPKITSITYKHLPAEVYFRTKWHHYPFSRLATTDMGRKLGAVPVWGWTWVPI